MYTIASVGGSSNKLASFPCRPPPRFGNEDSSEVLVACLIVLACFSYLCHVRFLELMATCNTMQALMYMASLQVIVK